MEEVSKWNRGVDNQLFVINMLKRCKSIFHKYNYALTYIHRVRKKGATLFFDITLPDPN